MTSTPAEMTSTIAEMTSTPAVMTFTIAEMTSTSAEMTFTIAEMTSIGSYHKARAHVPYVTCPRTLCYAAS